MSSDRRTLRWVIAAGIVIGIALAPAAYALTFNVQVSSDVEFSATPNGPTVYFDEARNLSNGEIAPASNSLYIRVKEGSAHYNGTADTRARIDTVNGTWSNVSKMDVTAGNLTINPDKMAEASIKGDAERFAFKGEATVNDGTIDAVVAGTGGSARITLATNGTDGETYGLVDVETGRVLAFGTATNGGVVYFSAMGLSSHKVSTQQLGNLSFREATRNHPVITTAGSTENTVVTLFGPAGNEIAELEDADEDGEVDLAGTGLSLDKQFTAQVESPNHNRRTVVIEDLSQQSTIFLLNNTDNVEKEFVIQDDTGQFDSNGTQLIIERPIDTSQYSSGDIEYKAVAGDRVGADREYATTLQEDIRYRMKVRNADGEVRQIGSYTPESGGARVQGLELDNLQLQQENQTDVAWNATRVSTGSGDEVVVGYNDTTQSTSTLWIEIYERGNRSNKLFSNNSYAGPLGSVGISEPIPAAENDTEWMVRVTADRDGADDFNALEPLTPRNTVLGGLPAWVTTVMSLGFIWVTAGLFSQTNGDVGALVVAGMGAMFWFVGFAPGTLGVGVVILSMVTAGLIFINERRDGGL